MEGREVVLTRGSTHKVGPPWPEASLDEICTISSGITKGRKPPSEPLNEVPYMAVVNVQDGRLNLDLVKTIQASAAEIERYQLLPGDLLLTEGGDPDKLGRGTIWNGEIDLCIHQNHIFRVRSNSPLINMSYLSRLVASPVGKAYFLAKAKQTTGIASINLTQLRSFPVPLPPLNEQRRIAAKLDTTLAAVDACRQRLDGVAAILKRFRQAVLATATSGELTREWRGERGKQDSTEKVLLGEVILEMRNGLSPKPTMSPPGTKTLRIGAVRSGSVDWEDYRYLDLSAQEIKAFKLKLDDLLFTRYNGTLEFVGVCARVGDICDEYVYPDKLIRARCDPGRALPTYIEIAFGADNVRSQVEGCVKSSAGQKGISGADLRGIGFALPSIEEQHEIVRRTQRLFTLADHLEARLTAARKIVDRLTPALLAKAFRGELVPQDPGDEPASMLLERLAAKRRAARQAEAGASKPSRRGRPKAAAIPDQLPLDAAPVPPDFLAGLLRECGALSERALLAVSELDPDRFEQQLFRELERGTAREVQANGQVLLEAVS
jgi:type I restriction enzyme S subunit